MSGKTLLITLEIQGPALTRATKMGRPGVDAPFLTTPDGRCAFPATLVKGRLREAWAELRSHDPTFAPDVGRWLGEGPDRHGMEPQRGALSFDGYFIAASQQKAVRYRIALDQDTRSARTGAHQVVDLPLAPGEIVAFSGRLPFFARDPSEAEGLRGHVHAGLQWLTAIGGLKGIGFGRVSGVRVELDEASAPALRALPRIGRRMAIVLKPRNPFCVSRRQPSANLFESSDRIPGGAIKGALASTWRASLGLSPAGEIDAMTDAGRRELADRFERVRFTFAVPSRGPSPARPPVPPLSLVRADGRTHDVALLCGPCLIRGESPRFSPDWKHADRDSVHAALGHVSTRTELRVRTAIDASARRAKDEQLFAYEMVVPATSPRAAGPIASPNTAATASEWRAEVWLPPAVTDPDPDQALDAMASQLGGLLSSGLSFLGKTKTTADVEIEDAGTWTAPGPLEESLAARDGVWVLTLQTDALMLDARGLDETTSRETARQAYEAYWTDVSGGSLRLIRHFSGESLAGGPYFAGRFMGIHASPKSASTYHPYLLTTAGSVFVLTATADSVAAGVRVKDFRECGLPLPGWVDGLHPRNGRPGRHWSNCPFVPENGYGEVAVNLALHWDWRPPAESVTTWDSLGGAR